MGDDSEKKKIDEEVPMIDVKDGKGAQLEGKRFFHYYDTIGNWPKSWLSQR